MTKALFIIIALIICFQILYQKEDKKIIWLLGGILFFPHSVSIFDYPFALTFHRLFIYSLLFDTFSKTSSFKEFKKMPLFLGFIIILIAYLITGIFDDRLNLFLKLYRPITLFIENFLILFLVYYNIKSFEGVIRIFKVFLFFLLVFSIYGISNYITKNNEYYNLLESTFGTSNFANINMDLGLERFRISSFAFHAILYGLFLSIGILVFLFLYYTKQIKKRYLYISICLLIFVNLLLVNSRTPMLSLMLGVIIFFLFGINVKGKIQFIALGVIFLISSAAVLKDYTNLFSASLNVISSESTDISGSSIEMRKNQLNASINVFNTSPITGNGFEYIGESLGLVSMYNKEALLGVESYLFKLLIEQGLVGVFSNIIFFSSLFLFLIKKAQKKYTKEISVISIAMLSSFLLFILGTGALTSFSFFMILLGVCLKGIKTTSEGNKL